MKNGSELRSRNVLSSGALVSVGLIGLSLLVIHNQVDASRNRSFLVINIVLNILCVITGLFGVISSMLLKSLYYTAKQITSMIYMAGVGVTLLCAFLRLVLVTFVLSTDSRQQQLIMFSFDGIVCSGLCAVLYFAVQQFNSVRVRKVVDQEEDITVTLYM